MVLDIFTGRKFSWIKLLVKTNQFFNNFKLNRIITNKNSNYIVKIGKHSIKIITSTATTADDIKKIQDYVETTFNGCSILVESTGDLQWMTNMKNVSVTFLNK